MKEGYLIVLEGADGTGKGTQFSKLQETFSENKIPFTVFDFPRYYTNFWGKMVGRYLNREFGDMDNISPYLRTMFFILDQADAKEEIRKAKKKGNIVLCNRYVTSQIFQAGTMKKISDKDKYWRWLEKAFYKHLGGEKPDLVIGLYATPKVAFENIEKKQERKYSKGKKRDMNEENFDLQKAAARELVRQCNKRKDWILIKVTENNRMKSVETVTSEIISILKQKLQIKII